MEPKKTMPKKLKNIEFEKVKIFKNYFPKNNIDQVINQSFERNERRKSIYLLKKNMSLSISNSPLRKNSPRNQKKKKKSDKINQIDKENFFFHNCFKK